MTYDLPAQTARAHLSSAALTCAQSLDILHEELNAYLLQALQIALATVDQTDVGRYCSQNS